MNEPTGKPQDNMYEVVFPVPDVTGSEGNLTLVIALSGYADAGNAVSNSASLLLDALEHRPLVNFSTDELIDYRSRRPAVTMDHDQITEVSDLNLSLNVVRDNVGKPFLLLTGPEPDMRWDAFSSAVADLAERYSVGRTVSLYSAPMTVPHTRPLGIIAHGTDKRKLSDMHTWGNRVTVPGAASLNIEYELSRRGCDAFGFTAQVPHYVATSEYPLASLRLLQEVAKLAKLDIPLEALENESARVAELLNKQTHDSGEVSQLVNLLEEQYDQEAQRRQALETSPLLGPDGEMPSADEIGAEFEKFLASQPLRPVDHSSELDDEPEAPADIDSSAPTADTPDTGSKESQVAPATDALSKDLPEEDAPSEKTAQEHATEADAEGEDAVKDDEQLSPALFEDNESEAEQTPDEKPASEESGKPEKRRHRRGWKPWFRF